MLLCVTLGSELVVPVRVNLLELWITFHQQLIPLFTSHSWRVQGARVAQRKDLRRHVFVQGRAVRSVEDDSLPQLLSQERLEQAKDNVEDPRLVDDVDGLDTQWNTVLEPVHDLQGLGLEIFQLEK